MNPVVTKAKTTAGNFFEDFSLGQVIHHATPRTVTEGDVSLYSALYGTRFAVQSAESFAKAIGYPRAPVDDLLVFHVVFGKTVPDVSLNAVANLGYAEGRWLRPVWPGDTLTAQLEVTKVEDGLATIKVVTVNQNGESVVEGEAVAVTS